MKTKSKIYINISLFVAIAIVIIMFFVWPLFGDIKKDSVDLINQKNEVFSFEEQMIELKEFSQNKKYYQDNFLTAESMFIDYKNPIVLIKFLEDIAKDSNVDLNISLSSSSIQKVEKDVWSSIFFQVNFSGSLANSLKFLNKLENAPYLISVQSLKMNKANEVTKKGEVLPAIIKTDCLIKVYSK